MAEWTGLEPATPGVTGRYSNQLNYHSFNPYLFWWVLRGSNPRPSPCKGDALPAELSTRYRVFYTRYPLNSRSQQGKPRKERLTFWRFYINRVKKTNDAAINHHLLPRFRRQPLLRFQRQRSMALAWTLMLVERLHLST